MLINFYFRFLNFFIAFLFLELEKGEKQVKQRLNLSVGGNGW